LLTNLSHGVASGSKKWRLVSTPRENTVSR